jgi:hypothetical protein
VEDGAAFKRGHVVGEREGRREPPFQVFSVTLSR